MIKKWLLGVLLAALALSGIGGAAAQDGDPLGGATTFAKANAPTTLTVMLDWTPNTNHLGLYVAQAKGYFAEANLTVDIQPAGDISVEQVVATGAAAFGISYQETFTYVRANELPIVSIAAILQHNTSGFASLREKHPLTSPADLVGLRYGGFGSMIEKPIIERMIACGGKEGTVDIQDIGFVEPFPLMEREAIDFVWLFRGWDGLRAELSGLEVDYLMLKDYPECVPDYYTPILITNEAHIAEQPDVVAAFVQAAARGYADAISDPSGAAAILLEANPDLDEALVKASAEYLSKEFMADAPRWGEQRLIIWEAMTAFMVESGTLEKPIESGKAFTNEFLPGKGAE
ncbi:MAG TPA: ABC transporter substrate-binding protein [Aggregatilineales bacterium]|nr:ABC transporter substrate-binding protein [Anaerolineales bacterium]HRE47435.1 ABC transporter substrate-binding protein [Aggregatilineales bacterium]